MGLLLLSVVVTSRPEAFRPHHRELLRLLNETLGEVGSPGLLFYSLRTLTTMAPYLSIDDVVRCGPLPSWFLSSSFRVLPLADADLLEIFFPWFLFCLTVERGSGGWLSLDSYVQTLRKLPVSGAGD